MATATAPPGSPLRRGHRIDVAPIVDLRTGTVVREELLLRMVPGIGGSLQPPVLDRLVVRVAQVAAARGRRVAVNVSEAAVGDQPFLAAVERVVGQPHVRPGAVTFELTAPATADAMAAASCFAERARALGCPLVLDDFGAGAAGPVLDALPFTAIKLDIRTLRDPAWSRSSRAVIGDMADFAHERGLAVIADGIEAPRTLAVLRGLGVEYGQGGQVGRPQPLLSTLLARH